MASKIEICNLALNRIAANTVVSLDEGTQSARAVALVYDTTLAEMLEKHHWNFARIRRTLSRLAVADSELPPEWAFAYALPTDMAKFLYFEGQGITTAWPVENGEYRSATGYTRWPGSAHEIIGDRIFSNSEDGIAIYTAQVTDTSKFTAAFTNAFIEALAAKLIMPIKGDERRYLALKDSANRELNMAIAWDLNNQDMVITSRSTFEQARY